MFKRVVILLGIGVSLFGNDNSQVWDGTYPKIDNDYRPVSVRQERFILDWKNMKAFLDKNGKAVKTNSRGENSIDIIKNKSEYAEDSIRDMLDVSILQAPVYKVLRPVDTIQVSTNFATVIEFPKGWKVVNSVAFFKTAYFSFQKIIDNDIKTASNFVRFQPLDDNEVSFRYGNMLIDLSNGKENRSIMLIIKKYKQEFCSSVRVGGIDKYYCSGDFLGLLYKYKEVKKINPFEAIRVYKKLCVSGCKKIEDLKSGEFVVYNDEDKIIRYIMRDDKFGDLFIGGKGFRVW